MLKFYRNLSISKKNAVLIFSIVFAVMVITTFVTIAVVSFLFFTQVEINSITQFSLGGIQMQFGVNNYTYIFAILVLGLSLLASLYSIKYMQNKDRLGYFYSNFILTVAGMVGIIFSRDFISFFIFWEIMTWSSYLIVIYDGARSSKSGLKYMIFSAIGAYAMLTAIVSIKGSYGTFIISDAIEQGAFNFTDHIYIPIMLLLGFAVKAALMPLHVWAPNAYSKSPM